MNHLWRSGGPGPSISVGPAAAAYTAPAPLNQSSLIPAITLLIIAHHRRTALRLALREGRGGEGGSEPEEREERPFDLTQFSPERFEMEKKAAKISGPIPPRRPPKTVRKMGGRRAVLLMTALYTEAVHLSLFRRREIIKDDAAVIFGPREQNT